MVLRWVGSFLLNVCSMTRFGDVETVDEFCTKTMELFFVPFVRFADLAYRPG